MPEFEENTPLPVWLAMVACWLVALALGLTLACTPAQLNQVQDASDKRAVICRFVETWTPNQPELAEIRTLCRAGADLQEIAAAYAGCRETPAE
jgi:hypothetical protein